MDAPVPRFPPFCRHLSSKKVLGRDRPPLTAADVLDGSRWCWCAATSQLLGPDREPAHPDQCLKHRGCFESAFADLT